MADWAGDDDRALWHTQDHLGELLDEIERLNAERDKWKVEAGIQNFGLSMANEDCETKDAEIECLRVELRELQEDLNDLYGSWPQDD